MPLDTSAPVYTDAQRALWDTLAEIVRTHSPADVLDALSDAFLLHDDVEHPDSRRMASIGRAIEGVRNAHLPVPA